MTGPSLYLTLPPLSRFKFPPDSQPVALPAPSPTEWRLKSPFGIDPKLYNDVLRPELPLTFAVCYIITVWMLNAYNRSRNNKPWWISTTRFFKVFVILHNIFLALYSAITFIAMVRAMGRIMPDFNYNTPPAAFADALCKLHGPRGLGDAATWNTTLNTWEVKNKIIQLAPDGTPDPTDVGRMWGEGLAFWGWFFYLSKFYEVLDTLIILARGKRSPTLQTYHHAGAMLCMWAGIRYMSAPIWLFVFLNSFIHSLMYVYFTLASLGIRVPQALKRTLTTMQIMQFVFGASYAAIHLFIQYDIPITTSYKILHPITSVASVASASAVSATSAIAQATSTAAPFGALVKRLLLRAAGDEGVAENVRDRDGHVIMPGVVEAVQAAAQKYNEETVYRTEYTKVDCVDTTGQTFAIWLNLFYLFPLTILFARFFVRAYYNRTLSSTFKRNNKSKRSAAIHSSVDAAKGVNREFDDAGKAAEDALNRDVAALRSGTYKSGSKDNRPVSDRVQSFERRVSVSADRIAHALSPSPSATRNDAASAVHDAAKNVKTEDSTSDLKNSTSHLSVGDNDSEYDSNANSPAASPSKSKKRRNKKKKSLDAQTAGQEGADVAKEEHE